MSKNELSDGWEWSTLGQVCEINPRRPGKLEAEDAQDTSFVPMESVDGDLGTILDMKVSPFSKVKKGYTYFEENDVLFAKITPCMQNKKSAIANGLINGFGFGTTEFHVLRCKERVVPKWIYYFVRNQRFVDEAQKNFTGAVGQQRVPKTFLENYPIIVPPIIEQEKIVLKLERQMAQIEMMKKEAEKCVEFPQKYYFSYLNSKFENLCEDNSILVSLKDVCKIRSGQVDPKKEEYKEFPHIYGKTIESGTGRLLNYNTVEKDQVTSGKYFFKAGDVLYSKLRPYLQKVVYVDFDGLCSADMYPLEVDTTKVNPYWLVMLLLSDEFTSYAIRESSRARMPKLNREQFYSWKFFLPTLDIQQKQVEKLQDIIGIGDEIREEIQLQLEAINQLPNSLLNEVFGKYEIPDEA